MAAHDKDPEAWAGTAPVAQVILCPHAAVPQTLGSDDTCSLLTAQEHASSPGPAEEPQPGRRVAPAESAEALLLGTPHLRTLLTCITPGVRRAVASHTGVGALT